MTNKSTDVQDMNRNALQTGKLLHHSNEWYTHYNEFLTNSSTQPNTDGSSLPTIICLHGSKFYSFFYDHLASSIVKDTEAITQCRVITYDLLGRGGSSAHYSKQYGLQEHLEQLEQIIAKLHVRKPFCLVGHSLSGSIVTNFVSLHPSQVRSIVLLAPAGLSNPFPFKVLRFATLLHGTVKTKLMSEKEWKSDFGDHRGSDSETEYTDRLNDMIEKLKLQFSESQTALDAAFQSILKVPLAKQKEKIKGFRVDLDVLLIWGNKDTGVPYKTDYSRWLRALEESNCKFLTEVITGAGHALLLEEPEVVTTHIKSFIKKTMTS